MLSSTETAPPEGAEEGTIRWTDDIARGLRDDDYDDDDDDGGEERVPPTADVLFGDPDPTRTFTFRFPRPARASNGDDDDDDDDGGSLNIELRGFKAESDQVWKSTGLTLWRAAGALCDFMVDHAELLEDKRIVELGAGLGLCGILAHRMTTNSSVCLTDGDTDALVQLRENVELNKKKEKDSLASTADGSSSDGAGTITCRQLLWGRETSEAFLERHGGGRAFDMLLASDIVYAAVVVGPLWETVRTLLDREEGIFLFAYCSKREVPITIDVVLEAAERAGFSYECVDDRDGILVYIFRWKE